jgi:hypothetical protein
MDSDKIENNENDENKEIKENKEIDLTLEDVFINLTLISKIEVGNKLVQNDKHVNIDTSYFPSITRWYYGLNRNDNLSFIRLILHKAFDYNNKLLDDSEEDTNIQLLVRLNTDLEKSIDGLSNLKQTYYYDKLVQSEIDVMVKNIRSKLETNTKIINFNVSGI